MTLTRAVRFRSRESCRPRVEDLECRTMLTGGIDALIGASATRDLYHVDGSGLAAAMIDTGIDPTHEAFGSQPVGPGNKISDGYNFADKTSDVTSPLPHGTATAGIVASQDATNPGVAPGANIVELKIFDNSGNGTFQNVINALQYALDNHVKDHISVVNMSLSDGGNYSADYFSTGGGVGGQIASLIHELDLQNIPVVTAAGNSFNGSTQGMGVPAILSETISVTGSKLDDTLLPDAQRLGTKIGGAAATDLAAPGDGVPGPSSGNGFSTFTGTSYAAPLVTGSILLLQQIYENRFGSLPTVAQVSSWLKAGSLSIHDATTGIDIGRLDIAAAAALIPNVPGTPPAPPAPPTGPTTPANPPTPSLTPMTQVFVDGKLNGTIAASAVDDPMAGFTDADGNLVNFDQVQLWTANGTNASLHAAADQTPAAAAGVTTHYDTVDVFNPRPAGSAVAALPITPAPVASAVSPGTAADLDVQPAASAFSEATATSASTETAAVVTTTIMPPARFGGRASAFAAKLNGSRPHARSAGKSHASVFARFLRRR